MGSIRATISVAASAGLSLIAMRTDELRPEGQSHHLADLGQPVMGNGKQGTGVKGLLGWMLASAWLHYSCTKAAPTGSRLGRNGPLTISTRRQCNCEKCVCCWNQCRLHLLSLVGTATGWAAAGHRGARQAIAARSNRLHKS